MSSYQINAIVTRALVDTSFKEAILNGQRRQRLQEFELPPELVDVIMSLEGNDIHQFIYQLNNLAASKKNQTFCDFIEATPIVRYWEHAQGELHNTTSQGNRSEEPQGP